MVPISCISKVEYINQFQNMQFYLFILVIQVPTNRVCLVGGRGAPETGAFPPCSTALPLQSHPHREWARGEGGRIDPHSSPGPPARVCTVAGWRNPPRQGLSPLQHGSTGLQMPQPCPSHQPPTWEWTLTPAPQLRFA